MAAWAADAVASDQSARVQLDWPCWWLLQLYLLRIAFSPRGKQRAINSFRMRWKMGLCGLVAGSGGRGCGGWSLAGPQLLQEFLSVEQRTLQARVVAGPLAFRFALEV